MSLERLSLLPVRTQANSPLDVSGSAWTTFSGTTGRISSMLAPVVPTKLAIIRVSSTAFRF